MYILLTGSVAFDYLMTFPGYFRDHILPDKLDSICLSFLVDSFRQTARRYRPQYRLHPGFAGRATAHHGNRG